MKKNQKTPPPHVKSPFLWLHYVDCTSDLVHRLIVEAGLHDVADQIILTNRVLQLEKKKQNKKNIKKKKKKAIYIWKARTETTEDYEIWQIYTVHLK